MRPAQFKSTVRHYLSNQNLRKDLIIHEKMCSSGWIRINDLPAHQIMQARRVPVHMLLKRRASVHSDQGTAEEPKTKAGQLGLQHGQEAAMEENIRRAAPAREESTAGRRASVHSDQGTAEPQQKESTQTRLRGPAPDLAGGRARALWTLYGPVFGFRLPTPLGLSPLFVLPTLRRSWSGNQTNRDSTSCDKHSWACYVYRAAGEVGDAGIVAEALDIAEGRPVAVEDATRDTALGSNAPGRADAP
jgi:hypothetical protein